ncbi:surface-adhesin E family protein [Niabella insulamsoli]|uniref:surface-adhesin E family protein n=1 Tax=Niabella insulamsoli TaxID=3144874 RepID=UPI0031FDFD9D
MKLFFICFLLCIASVSASGQNHYISSSSKDSTWLYVSMSTNGDVYYIRKKPVKKTSESIRVWTKNYWSEKEIDNKKFEEGFTLILWDFFCEEAKVKTLAVLDYGSNGDVISKVETDDILAKSSYVVPGSIAESLMEAACEL